MYQICVNAAGCLPDSDEYPYTVDDAADAASAVRDELDAYADGLPYAFDPRTVPARLAETGGYLAIPLEGSTYCLTIEPAHLLQVRSVRA